MPVLLDDLLSGIFNSKVFKVWPSLILSNLLDALLAKIGDVEGVVGGAGLHTYDG